MQYNYFERLFLTFYIDQFLAAWELYDLTFLSQFAVNCKRNLASHVFLDACLRIVKNRLGCVYFSLFLTIVFPSSVKFKNKFAFLSNYCIYNVKNKKISGSSKQFG